MLPGKSWFGSPCYKFFFFGDNVHMAFLHQRIHVLKKIEPGDGPICYWMSRDQRLHDNWALIFAQQRAKERGVPLIICFCVVDSFLGALLRQFAFMLDGLKEVAERSEALGIPFFLLHGEPTEVLPRFFEEVKVGAVVTDVSPLRIGRQWREKVAEKITVPMVEVDAHNIVPVWKASPKAEFGAHTFRPKINKLLPAFLEEFPIVEKQPEQLTSSFKKREIDWQKILEDLKCDNTVPPVDWLKSGEEAARKTLDNFIENHLEKYDDLRNDPSIEDGQSNLSPYLHFGQLSAQRVALAVQQAADHDKRLQKNAEVFLEELIVRRELSDNFCWYTPDYDKPSAWPNWAKLTHAQHRTDPRDVIYSFTELDEAKTGDPAWNAAQNEMKRRGKMHGYMRMYWAKKILEWSASPEDALERATTLNDRYFLDGRDPNGYVGIQWSIGGLHDRAWFEREVFGKIRYMNFNGLKRKFDIEKYIQRWT